MLRKIEVEIDMKCMHGENDARIGDSDLVVADENMKNDQKVVFFYDNMDS